MVCLAFYLLYHTVKVTGQYPLELPRDRTVDTLCFTSVLHSQSWKSLVIDVAGGVGLPS